MFLKHTLLDARNLHNWRKPAHDYYNIVIEVKRRLLKLDKKYHVA